MNKTFKMDLARVVRQIIATLPAGTVGVSRDCLWQLSVTGISRLPSAPQGTNGAYFARQTFNEVVDAKPFRNFVYAN